MFTRLKITRIFIAALVLGLGSLSWGVEEPEAVPGEYIVKLRDGPVASRLLRQPAVLSERLGAPVQSYIRLIHGVLVKRAPVETQESAIRVLSQDPLVKYAEPNYIYRAFKRPSHDKYRYQWGLRNVSSKGGVSGFKAGINAEDAWDMTTGSKGVLVAVMDSGIDYKHPNLIENIWANPGESGKDSKGKDKSSNGVDDDSNGYVDDVHGINVVGAPNYEVGKPKGDSMDVNGHGTHCAGIIGAYSSDNKGVVGVNWNVRMAAMRFLNDEGKGGTTVAAILAINYAIAIKAKVISASWGGGDRSQALQDAIEQANEAGILWVAAAGNGDNNGGVGTDNDLVPSYPASYPLENIISVAALGPNGELAQFSNYGKTTVHLGAPGVDILSTLPKEEWDYHSGTSMATPFVTGVAALVLSALPQPDLMTPKALKEVILSGVRPLNSLSGKVSSGGMLNAPDAVMVGIVRNVDQVLRAMPKN